ncbi:MAG: ABC transporter permease subunit [Anaerolineae bacterium]|nr:ABC transporter permease subunit [Anaerolineae bacterium]NIN98014.1 ABC transporter permease subunit [Anaerolineae bacterium]NIQ80959.1 ABC transporter permease subunit [Anaerolineae bacterium]
MSDTWYSFLLITPGTIIIVLFAAFPLLYAINLSLRHVDLTSAVGIGPYVGLDNFRFALNDTFFWQAARRTVIFAIGAVTVEMVLGIGIAFLLNGLRWGQGIVRSLLILPLAAAPAAVGLVWRYMYHPDFGVYNAIMSILGLPERNWLGAVELAMPSVIVFDIWQWTPFVALIVLAGLQSLPKEPFEAAELDGASTWQVLRRLTFPMLGPVLTLVFVLRSIDAIRLYDAIVSLTHGGPGTATETLTYYLYRLGMKFFRLDQASAISLMFLYVTIIFTGVALRSMMRAQAERAGRA